MKYIIIVCIFFLNISVTSANAISQLGAQTNASVKMSQDKMENIIVNKVKVIKRVKGYILFKYKKVKMSLISDVKHDRMRIISAITNYSALNYKVKDNMMKANFHLALDARYAVSKDVLYSAFIHPLSTLSKQELISALNQVATLSLTFGSTYSSGELKFNGSN